MKSTVEPLEGNKVKVSVEVDEEEFEKAIDAAFKKIAREVRIPGFRPGKAPRKVLEARFGIEAARGQALQDALPEYYLTAVKEHQVDVIAPPEIDITTGEESGPVAFDAVVEVRPKVTIGGYRSLRVTIPSPVPTDAEIDEQLERLRQRFAELETVDRPAADGDFVTVDIKGTQGAEVLDGLTADDYLYEIGAGSPIPEIDENLRGAKPGDILEFNAANPDPEAADNLHFRILVKEVKAKVLLPLDDSFAAEASEFETLAELRDDFAKRLSRVKKIQAQMALRERASEALAALVTDDPPKPLVDTELRNRLQDFALRLQAQGIDPEQYLAMTGKTEQEIVDELRGAAELAVKVDLALRAIAEAEAIDVTDDELEEEYAAVAQRLDIKPAEVRRRFERSDQVEAVRSDLRNRKAFEWLCDQLEIVDEEGNVIARASLEIDGDSPSQFDDRDGEAGSAATGDNETEDDE
ncbi:MAG: trigger factor [Acidimicrobiales bacterium]|nr:trigger factor [Acidimicrobiales bacterium]